MYKHLVLVGITIQKMIYYKQYCQNIQYLTMSSLTNYKRIKSLNYFFENIPFEKRSQMELDEAASFSITRSDLSDQMSTIIINTLKKYEIDNPVILDGLACVGGNTISFSKYFSKVFAVELDKVRFEMLHHNVQTVLKIQNVYIYNQCLLKFTNTNNLKFHALFLDPEWGGPSYKSHRRLKLSIGRVPVETFCVRMFNKNPELRVIALKLPLNYDFDELESFNNHLYGLQYNFHKIHKISFVVLTTQHN